MSDWIQRLFPHATAMGERHRAFDWESTPIGPPAGWETPLKTLVPIMLASNQPMFIAWGAARTLLYNDAYAEILGNKHPAALGQDFLQVWHEIRADLDPIVAAAYRGEPVQMDRILLWMERRGFREETYFSFFYAPVCGESGAVSGFLCACTEITGEVMAERRLAESEARHRGVLVNMDEAFTLFDQDFTILEVNDGACRLVGMTREEMIGRNHWERFPGTYDSELGRLYRQVLASGQPGTLEHHYEFEDGRKCWLEARIFTVGAGLAVLFRDVTERRRVYEQAAHAAERIQLAMDVAQLGTWQWDVRSGAITADHRCRAICGLRTGDAPLTMSELRERVHPDDWSRIELALAHAIQPGSGAPYAEEFRWQHADGRIVWTASRGLVLFETVAGERRPLLMIGSVLDITERLQMLDALQEADRRKDEFLAMLAHELRNPLAPIKTAAHVLRRTGGVAQQVDRASEVIERQVGHLTRLVDDLLDVSRVTRGLVTLERAPVDLQSVVSAAVEQTRALVLSRGHQLHTVLEGGPYVVRGDHHRLVQVVANLLHNAAKYTAQGGTIELHLGTTDDAVQLQVRDDGVGIVADLLPHVFDLFTQAERTPDRAQGGLGIGLALVRSMVELHGGHVRAESAGQHQGSVFTVTLPRLRVSESAQATEHVTSASTTTQRRVMVVDDNVDAAEMLAAALRLAGHHVETLQDAASALRLVAATATPWDFFVLDIGLPDMTGYELAGRLRGLPAAAGSAVFVALTGYGQEHDRVMSRAAGFQHHVVKPGDTHQLLQIIGSAVPTHAPV
jgi:PAS domain S-box-containing protein